jgi:hypothetical protein
MSVENLNLREALRRAREHANQERNRTKCKRYYRKRVESNKLKSLGENASGLESE